LEAGLANGKLCDPDSPPLLSEGSKFDFERRFGFIFREHSADKDSAGRQMFNWRENLEQKLAGLRFGDLRVETNADKHMSESHRPDCALEFHGNFHHIALVEVIFYRI
jgi:hypothetical protein